MISNAYAQAVAPTTGGDPLPSFFIIIGMFVLMYFFMIRPQQKKAKEHKAMVDALQKGDEVIAMGIIGKITRVTEGYVSLEVSDGNVLHIQKHAVTMLLPKGTYNDIAR
jgi:preprotein translocase subunit YajC